jgi:hypothetical protein
MYILRKFTFSAVRNRVVSQFRYERIISRWCKIFDLKANLRVLISLYLSHCVCKDRERCNEVQNATKAFLPAATIIIIAENVNFLFQH